MEHIKTKKLIDTCKNAGNILDLSNCKITYADCEIIAKHFKGTTLDLSYSKIRHKGVEELSKWPGITLHLSFNKIGDEGAQELSKWSGTTLNLYCNDIRDKGAQYFCSSIIKNLTLDDKYYEIAAGCRVNWNRYILDKLSVHMIRDVCDIVVEYI